MRAGTELSRGRARQQSNAEACVHPQKTCKGCTADCNSAVLQVADETNFNIKQTAVCRLQEAL